MGRRGGDVEMHREAWWRRDMEWVVTHPSVVDKIWEGGWRRRVPPCGFVTRGLHWIPLPNSHLFTHRCCRRITVQIDLHRCWASLLGMVALSACGGAPGALTYNPGLCPDWESNQRPFGL